jgi:hypothetical protein
LLKENYAKTKEDLSFAARTIATQKQSMQEAINEQKQSLQKVIDSQLVQIKELQQNSIKPVLITECTHTEGPINDEIPDLNVNLTLLYEPEPIQTIKDVQIYHEEKPNEGADKKYREVYIPIRAIGN